jgi:putative transposase
MPPPRRRLKRIEQPTHARYLTFSCYHRLPLLQNDTIKLAFRDALHQARDRHGFALYAWVIMPEHVHLLAQPAGDADNVQSILRRLKSPFATQVITRWRQLDAPILPRITDAAGRTRFWQPGGGYDRNIITDAALFHAIDYIHANPVRRGLVNIPTNYPWSSARWYAGDQDDTIPMDPLPV